jgi:hypothetical protein
MRYQQSWQNVAEDELTAESQANLEATIERALALGINHIETARGYGSSEMQLGRILPRLPREKLIVQTKVPPKDTREEFAATFELSMSLLKLDYVDLLAVHGINTRELLDMSLRDNGPLSVLEQARKDGRIGHIGFSTHGPTDVIVAAIETGRFDYVNLHWYYTDQSNLPAIEAAARHDMGVFIISPSDKGGKLYEPSERLVELCRPFTPMGFNDLFCLANDKVHTLSIGASKPSDFDAHTAVLPHAGNAAGAIAPVLDRLETAVAAALGPDWSATWHRGIPSWEEVPGQVNVYHTIRLYGLWKAFGMLEFCRMRYNLLGSGGHWFPGYKVANMDWDRLPEAVKDSPFADKVPDMLREAHEAFNKEDEKRLSES